MSNAEEGESAMMDVSDERLAIGGPKILLLGDSGCGKTHAIRLLLEAGLKHVHVLFTERGMSAVSDIPADKLSWHYIKPAVPAWKTQQAALKRVNTLSFKAQCEAEPTDKREHGQFLEVYDTMMNFVDDRTGKSYGPVEEFDSDVAFFCDGLTGISLMAMKLVTGSKMSKSPGDYQVAQQSIEDYIIACTNSLMCTVVLTSHLEREVNELTGGTTLMPSTLGRKLAPKLNRWFDDVIHVEREGASWFWSTKTANMALKSRLLGVKDKMAPSFVQLFDKWKKQGGVITQKGA